MYWALKPSKTVVSSWKETTEITAELAGVGGFLWLVFRILVGSAMAATMSDISVLKNDMAEMKARSERSDEKLDRLIERLATR